MANLVEYFLKLTTNADKQLEKLGGLTRKLGDDAGKLGNKFKSALSVLANTAIVDNIQRANSRLQELSESGIKLDSSMKDLQAITGATGETLDVIEAAARKSALTFGGSAADSVESYKILLSKLSPEIAKNVPALTAMGNSVSIMSKSMGGDSVAAANTLTTAMNQFGVDLSDPLKAAGQMNYMMNIMSQSAKDGSAEIPNIAKALEESGAMAQLAHVQFSETAAAVQILDKAGKVGAEGGHALANSLAIIGQGRFMPKSTLDALLKAGVDVNGLSDKTKSLGQRMSLLKPIMEDAALVSLLFGKENVTAGATLIKQSDTLDGLAKSYENSNNAVDHAKIVMSSFAEGQSRLKAYFDDIKISVFNATKGVLPYLETLANGAGVVGDFALGYNAVSTALKGSTLWTTIATSATNLFSLSWWSANIAMLAIPIAIAAIVGGVVYLVSKLDGWKGAWENLVQATKSGFAAMLSGAKIFGLAFVEPYLRAFDIIKLGWASVKSLWDEEGANADIAAIKAGTAKRMQALADEKGKLVGHLKDTQSSLKAVGTSFKWNSKSSLFGGASSGIPAMLGNIPLLSGNAATGGMATPGTSGAGKAAGAKTAEGIATGGTKSTVVQIKFNDLVGNITVTSATGALKDSVSDIEKQVAEALVRVLGMATQTAL